MILETPPRHCVDSHTGQHRLAPAVRDPWGRDGWTRCCLGCGAIIHTPDPPEEEK